MRIYYLENCQWEEYFPEKEVEKQGEKWLRGSRKIIFLSLRYKQFFPFCTFLCGLSLNWVPTCRWNMSSWGFSYKSCCRIIIVRVYHIWQLRISAQWTDSFIAVLTDRMLYEPLHPSCCWTKPFSEHSSVCRRREWQFLSRSYCRRHCEIWKGPGWGRIALCLQKTLDLGKRWDTGTESRLYCHSKWLLTWFLTHVFQKLAHRS